MDGKLQGFLTSNAVDGSEIQRTTKKDGRKQWDLIDELPTLTGARRISEPSTVLEEQWTITINLDLLKVIFLYHDKSTLNHHMGWYSIFFFFASL